MLKQQQINEIENARSLAKSQLEELHRNEKNYQETVQRFFDHNSICFKDCLAFFLSTNLPDRFFINVDKVSFIVYFFACALLLANPFI
ncbi:hypothetical protein B6N60_03430 [Richelia sinica FACHB-800]|uniref:Uncharacterized protein n=2 Tax=Richelia TaxID=98443 RepID=A0A975TB01_9NOST|nr:hypothetical protein B6N60_03430 [Richelia sinica FACHB-800]